MFRPKLGLVWLGFVMVQLGKFEKKIALKVIIFIFILSISKINDKLKTMYHLWNNLKLPFGFLDHVIFIEFKWLIFYFQYIIF